MRITFDHGKRRRTLRQREVGKDHRPYWVADLLIDASGDQDESWHQLSFIGRFIEALRRVPPRDPFTRKSPTQILHREYRSIFLFYFQ
jgi:hypothetical protein